jgi:hypothetical protein
VVLLLVVHVTIQEMAADIQVQLVQILIQAQLLADIQLHVVLVITQILGLTVLDLVK